MHNLCGFNCPLHYMYAYGFIMRVHYLKQKNPNEYVILNYSGTELCFQLQSFPYIPYTVNNEFPICFTVVTI